LDLVKLSLLSNNDRKWNIFGGYKIKIKKE
jgi:hypothetical protein